MNIMLMGAAGYLGRIVLRAILDKNIKVTAVIKQEENIKMQDYNLRIEKRDMLDPALEKVMEQHNIIVASSIFEDKSKKEQRLLYKNIISKMKDSGVKYILILLEMNKEDSLERKEQILELFKVETGIEWSVMIVPSNAKTGEKRGEYKYIDFEKEKINNSVFLEDIAEAVVNEIIEKKYIRKEFTIEY